MRRSNPLLMIPRRLMVLEDQYKQATDELKDRKAQLKQVRPPTASMKKDEQKIKILEN